MYLSPLALKVKPRLLKTNLKEYHQIKVYSHVCTGKAPFPVAVNSKSKALIHQDILIEAVKLPDAGGRRFTAATQNITNFSDVNLLYKYSVHY